MAERKATHIVANIYRGPKESAKHNRGVRAVEYGFKELGISFDQLVYSYLGKAFVKGRRKVTLLDVGSGDGGLFTSFLGDPALGCRTRSFLECHPQFQLEMFGLTDSPSIDKHLKQLPFKADESRLDYQKGQISASNFAYTLTRWQTLEDFLKDKKIDRLDLILATKSLGFLLPGVFKEVVQTGVDHLRPAGGKLIAYYFGGHLPWSWDSRNNGFRTNAGPENIFKHPYSWVRRDGGVFIQATPLSRFHYRSIETGEMMYGSRVDQFVAVLNAHIDNPLSREVREKDLILAREPGEYRALVERGWRFYQRLGFLTDSDMEEAKGALPLEGDPTEILDMLAKKTFSLAYRRLEKKQRLKNLRQKRRIITSIQEVDLRWTHVEEPNGGGFILTKK